MIIVHEFIDYINCLVWVVSDERSHALLQEAQLQWNYPGVDRCHAAENGGRGDGGGIEIIY